jgi:hypothetical protein
VCCTQRRDAVLAAHQHPGQRRRCCQSCSGPAGARSSIIAPPSTTACLATGLEQPQMHVSSMPTGRAASCEGRHTLCSLRHWALVGPPDGRLQRRALHSSAGSAAAGTAAAGPGAYQACAQPSGNRHMQAGLHAPPSRPHPPPPASPAAPAHNRALIISCKQAPCDSRLPPTSPRAAPLYAAALPASRAWRRAAACARGLGLFTLTGSAAAPPPARRHRRRAQPRRGKRCRLARRRRTSLGPLPRAPLTSPLTPRAVVSRLTRGLLPARGGRHHAAVAAAAPARVRPQGRARGRAGKRAPTPSPAPR